MVLDRSMIAIAVVLLVAPAWAGPIESGDPGLDPGATPRASSSRSRATAATAEADQGARFSVGSDIGWRGWGLRAGVADDPDQFLGGVHFNLGEFVPHLRFQPDVQLGAGDDHKTLYATVPVYYRFGTETRFTPYAGGGISLGFVDRDSDRHGDDTDFEIGGKVTGGLEWPRPRNQAFLVELSLGFGDVYDAQIIAGWSF
jgi:opacity protein-like surface antigen